MDASNAQPASVEDLLQLMVRYDTVNANLSGRAFPEGPLIDALEPIARSWGLATDRLPVEGLGENLLIRFAPVSDAPWLLFDAHLDTVAVQNMSIEPFEPRIADGRLYGRGSCDTKGSAAAMLWALREYASQPPHPLNVALLLSIDEEFGMSGIQTFLNHHLPALDLHPLGVIVGEPTELHPVVAHNGVFRWTLTVHGHAAHSSVPHEGRSAISLMARAIPAIEQHYIAQLDAEHPLTGRAVCSINVIRGGSAVNIIPDRCDVQIDRRVVPGESVQTIRQQVRHIAEQALRDVKLPDEPPLEAAPAPELADELIACHPPLSDVRNGPLLQQVKAALKSLDLPQLHLGAPFGTHAGFCDQANLPAIVLGPGDPARAHQAAEWIDLPQLHAGVKLYHRIMRQGPPAS